MGTGPGGKKVPGEDIPSAQAQGMQLPGVEFYDGKQMRMLPPPYNPLPASLQKTQGPLIGARDEDAFEAADFLNSSQTPHGADKIAHKYDLGNEDGGKSPPEKAEHGCGAVAGVG